MSDKNACSCSSGCESTPAPTPSGSTPDSEARGEETWFRSRFRIPGMDCPSEEQMIRLRLDVRPLPGIRIRGRTFVVGHAGDVGGHRATGSAASGATQAFAPLQTTSLAVLTTRLARCLALAADQRGMFVIEKIASWWADSAGLIADAADMLADAAVYGVALYAVGRAPGHKLRAARLSGLLQLVLAVGALTETGRRSLGAVPRTKPP